MKKAAFIVLLLITAGCGNSLKHSWKNFTAYYNTFYDAKKDFKKGLAEVNKQPIQIRPDTLVLVHPTPPLAGKQNFNNAVNNAADILRRFPNTKWTDNALLLIGKSYYYLHDFFKAQQKFNEVLALDEQTPLKQRAVIWEGRTLLGISSFEHGITFLNSELKKYRGDWKARNKAECQILLAEHNAMMNNWNRAASLLRSALKHTHDKKLRGRSYFLLGQLLLRQQDYSSAFKAFSRVQRNHLDYAYQYWAYIKRGEMARKSGNLALASSIYSSMINNNKNFKRRGEIYYQQALNYMGKGEYQKALTDFKKVLNSSSANSSDELLGKSYFKLGQLYRDHLKNYKMAAAYFDSASTQYSGMSRGVNTQKVHRLASAYKKYVELKHEIDRDDSLLALGSLSKKALRKKLVSIHHQQKHSLETRSNAFRGQNNPSNSVTRNIDTPAKSDQGAAKYGFLDYKNAQMVRREKQKFIAVWGQRPLEDNWRRKDVGTAANTSGNQDLSAAPDSSGSNRPLGTAEGKMSGLNIGNIPETARARKKLQHQQLQTKYQLGSLFFLTLNQPDSAAYYYHRILHGKASSSLQARALYSLYELYHLNEQPDSASKYKAKILNNFKGTRFARQIQKNSGNAPVATSAVQDDSTGNLIERMRQILNLSDSLSEKNVAAKLHSLALNHMQSPEAPLIYYQAIRHYIRFAELSDSVRAIPDTLMTVAPDSVTASYTGQYWDRVRKMIQKFKKSFPDDAHRHQVNLWLSILEDSTSKKSIPTCKTLGVRPRIIPGKKHFVRSIKLPEKVKHLNMSGNIRFQLTIKKDGSVGAYKLLSPPTHTGLEQAYEKAIRNSLHFKPIQQHGKAVKVSCKVTFPVH
ncbi:MAG TPA: tetratricopeptide repeat protein [Balneolaceae bacterium]|nr:tetratricopeptide repeat protein [Balneolaceae bacterium]